MNLTNSTFLPAPYYELLFAHIYSIFIRYTTGIPITKNTAMAIYADDTAILCATIDPEEISNLLQIRLDSIIDDSSPKGRIKINPDKSIQYVPCRYVKMNRSPSIYF